MKVASLLLLSLALAAAGPVPAAETQHAHVAIASTTDLHGRIYPIDYFTDRPFGGGLAKISTTLQELRRRDPDLILVDSGDTIEGNPLAYYHAMLNNAPVDPMMLVMNRLRYDSMTVGNHEFNYGLAVQGKARSEAKFPWLSANIYAAGTGKPAYTPYIVKVVKGVRIGILGLTTPGIPYWEQPKNYAGLDIRDPLPEARKWVGVLRQDEHVDAVVVAMHMGLEENLATGAVILGNVPHENRAMIIARQVPGIDLILMGHTHQEVPPLVINGVLMVQPGRWGDHVAKSDLYFTREGAGPWRLAAKQSQTISMSEVPADPAVLAMTKSYHAETEKWLSQPVGTCDRDLDAEEVFADSALLDLIHRVQLEDGHADVSLASVFSASTRMHAGTVTVRELASLYVYDNTLVVVRANGARIKAALEHAAEFLLPYDPSKSLSQLTNPNMWLYNFDKAEGVSYEIDISRPVGERIRHLAYRGQPLAPDRELKVAINNYRFAGGGGYDMFKDCPVVYRSSIPLRDLLIAWVERHHSIPTTPVNNWKIVAAGRLDTSVPFRGQDSE